MTENTAPAPRLLPNALLALAFVTFVAIGIVTVLIPALSDDAEDEAAAEPAAAETETSPSRATSE